MFGIIGADVALGVVITQLIKRNEMCSFFGTEIQIATKPKHIKAFFLAELFLAWAWYLQAHVQVLFMCWLTQAICR